MAGGLVGSLILHVAVFGLIALYLLSLASKPRASLVIVPIGIVQLGTHTTSPVAAIKARVPQRRAREVMPARSKTAVPLALTRPPPDSVQSTTGLTAVASHPIAPQPPGSEQRAARHTPIRKSARRHTPTPGESLAARLQALASLRQPTPLVPPEPREQEGVGLSNVTAGSAEGVQGRDALYRLKDYIRAQIDRRWTPDTSALGAADWVVSLRLMIGAGGEVERAEIVDTPRLHTDSTYRDFALSARNAALLSSPLVIPAGAQGLVLDIVLDFESRTIFR